MRNKYQYITLGIAVILSLGSCKKYLDINTNPNSAQTVDGKLLFSFAATSLANNRAGGDLYYPMALGGQSISSGGSSQTGTSWGTGGEDQYVFSAFSFGNIWSQYYTSVGFNLKYAIGSAESAAPKNNNGAAQAKVLLAETFYELATIYGDVPFTEALNEDIKYPKFDEQKVVLQGVVDMLNEALGQFDATSSVKFSGAYDLFYGGDIDQWIAAAKSLKLRVLMTMVDSDPGKAEEIGSLVTEGGMISSADGNMKVKFETTSGKRNPKYQVKDTYLGPNAGGVDRLDFFYASPYVLDFMKSRNDPRIPLWFDTPLTSFGEGGEDYIAVQPGANADDFVNAKLSAKLHYADQPEYFFTYQEELFFEAEVYLRGLGVSANSTKANDMYKKAMTESALFSGIDDTTATAWVATLPNLNVISNPLVELNYQHWVDKMDRGLDAFTQWRRSGTDGQETPALALPENAPEGPLFRRYEYPGSNELLANPNAPEVIEYNVKTWFDL